MPATSSVVAVYDSHEQAEHAVKALQQAGVDMKSLSIAGRGVHTDEHVVGYYNAGANAATKLIRKVFLTD